MSGTDRAFIKAYQAVDADISYPAWPQATEPTPAVEPVTASPPPERLPPVAEPQTPAAGRWRPVPPIADDHLTLQERAMQIASQPLSTFSTPAPDPTIVDFQPALEVDAFRWPETCDSLLSRADQEFSNLATQLLEDPAMQRQVIAVAGMRRGEGRTTALLCLAKQLTQRGIKTVLVDGDFVSPALGNLLGLAVEIGWEAVLAGSLPLAESLIESQQDGLALLPLAGSLPSAQTAAGSLQVAVSIGMLQQHYDRVLLDVGPVLESNSTALSLLEHLGNCGTLLLRHVQKSREDEVAEVAQRLSSVGAVLLGVAENFVRPSASELARSA